MSARRRDELLTVLVPVGHLDDLAGRSEATRGAVRRVMAPTDVPADASLRGLVIGHECVVGGENAKGFCHGESVLSLVAGGSCDQS